MACVAGRPSRRAAFCTSPFPAPGNETEYRGVGILVYDIDNGHKFVKRIPTWPGAAGQQPEHVRGIAASASTRRLFVSTVKRLAAFDLVTEKIVWEKTYDGTCCDRLALSPDGATIYAPAFGAPKWYVDRCRERRAAGDDRRRWDGRARRSFRATARSCS